MKLRCKFVCAEKRETPGWEPARPVVYLAQFYAVNGGNDEDAKFAGAVPSGELTLRLAEPQGFEVGQDYYVDIKEAE